MWIPASFYNPAAAGSRAARVLWHLLLLTAVLGLPTARRVSAASMAGFRNRREFVDEVRATFLREDYATLEATAAELRTTKDRFPDGMWTLPAFYDGLDTASLPVSAVTDFSARLTRWRAAQPGSITASIAEANALLSKSWDASHVILPKGTDRAARAHAVIADAEKLSPMPPADWFDAALRVAIVQNLARRDFDHLYERAIAAEPGYLTFYFKRASYLRALGGPGEWEAYALDAGRHGLSGEGMGLYSRIAWSLSGNYSDQYLFKETEIQWPLMREGFRELDRLYPNADWNLNNFCRFACLAGDRDTARELFARIGDRWTSNWLSHAAYKEWAAWAQGQDAAAMAGTILQHSPDMQAWAVRFAPDGRSLFVGYEGGRLARWNLDTAQVLWEGQVSDDGGLVDAVDISPDGQWLAAGTSGRLDFPNLRGKIALWDLRVAKLAVQPAWRLEDNQVGVYTLCFSLDGKVLAASGYNNVTTAFGELSRFSVPDWQRVHHTAEPHFLPAAVLFLPPDGRRLAFAHGESFSVLDTGDRTRDFKPEGRLHAETVRAMAASPDGRTLACATGNGYKDRDQPGEVAFWDTATWTRRDVPHVATAGGMSALAWSPDGRWVAGGGYDGFVRAWDAVTGKQVAAWPPAPGISQIKAVAFAPDSRRIAAVRYADAVRVYAFTSPPTN